MPVNCKVSEWTYSNCFGTCDPNEVVQGTTTATRVVITNASGGGVPCPALTEELSCNIPPCGTDRTWTFPSLFSFIACLLLSDWSAYGSCDCSTLQQSSTRTFMYPQVAAANDCGETVRTRDCTGGECVSNEPIGSMASKSFWSFSVLIIVLMSVLLM